MASPKDFLLPHWLFLLSLLCSLPMLHWSLNAEVKLSISFGLLPFFSPTVFSLGISCMALDTSSMEVTSKTASSGLTIPQNFRFMCFCHWCLMSISDLIAKICRFSQVWVFHFLPHLSYNNYNNNNNNNSSIHWGCTIFQKLF